MLVLFSLGTALALGCFVWAARARRRIRYDGTAEPRRVFRARRAVLVFEGIGLLLVLVMAATVTRESIDLLFLAVAVVLTVPCVVAFVFPGVMGGRY